MEITEFLCPNFKLVLVGEQVMAKRFLPND
jgi:hypothetical protein